MTTFNIADLFELVADAIPDRPALVAGDVRQTYAELDDRSTRVAGALAAAGVQVGDHVGVLSGNRAEWLEVLLGCFKARAVPININYRYTRDEILYVLRDAEATALVVEAELAAAHPGLGAEVEAIRTEIAIGGAPGALDYEGALAAAPPDRSPRPRSGDDRYVLYTGGTTGMPKGVVWRIEDLFFGALRGGNPAGEPIASPEQIVEVLVERPDPWLVTSPMMHGNGQWNSLLPLLTGRGVVLWTGRRFDGDAIAELVEQERPGLLVLVGDAMALPFLEAVEGGRRDLSSIAAVGSGGAMLSPTTKERLGAALPGALIVDGFGASETGSNGAMVGSAGGSSLPRFTVNADVAVLGDDLRPVAPGEVGRLARRGHVPLGYWNDPVKTAATFPTNADGVRWAVPGDNARLEDDGTLTLLGRGSSCINTGGEKVHPDEVTHAIKAHPGVLDALVLGVPDERFGQAVAALVATDGPHPDDDAIREHLRPVLAGYKLPRRIVRVPEIRYTPQGKPDLAWAKEAVGA